MQDNLIVKFRIPCFIAALYKPFNTSKTSDFLSIHFTSQQKWYNSRTVWLEGTYKIIKSSDHFIANQV